jgi:hypothetical protein
MNLITQVFNMTLYLFSIYSETQNNISNATTVNISNVFDYNVNYYNVNVIDIVPNNDYINLFFIE